MRKLIQQPNLPYPVVCGGVSHPECECSKDELPRDLGLYFTAELCVELLCESCRKRLEASKEIEIVPAGVDPNGTPDFPPSAND